MEMKCLWCGETLVLSEIGWVHQAGTSYIARCDSCGWSGPSGPIRCPMCGGEVRDDHCAFPVPASGET